MLAVIDRQRRVFKGGMSTSDSRVRESLVYERDFCTREISVVKKCFCVSVLETGVCIGEILYLCE